MATIPHIAITGDNGEMGSQHGSATKGLIRNLVDNRLSLLCGEYGDSAIYEVERVARGLAESIRTALPKVYTETMGTAAAAGIEYWQLVVAGAYSDVHDLVGKRFARPQNSPDECTLIVSPDWPGRIFGTWDSHSSAGDALVVCHRRPSEGAEVVALTTAGWPMQQGVSKSAFAFAIANLVADVTCSGGVPYIAALIKASEASTARAFVDSLSAFDHASARYYMVTSVDFACGVELIPPRDLQCAIGPSLCHTNHFITPTGRSRHGRKISLSSKLRLENAERWSRTSTGMDKSLAPIVHHLANSSIIQNPKRREDDETHVAFALDPVYGQIVFGRRNCTENDIETVKMGGEERKCLI